MMTKKSSLNKTPKKPSKETKSFSVIQVNRRREWRIDLPLKALVEGKLPQGKMFKEKTTIENISGEGAYFGLDSEVTLGSKLKITIELPPKLAEGKNLKLRLNGDTVRLEKLNKKEKKQGVALDFDEEFKGEDFRIIAE